VKKSVTLLFTAFQFELVPGIGRTKMKLGMSSDLTKFAHSGGYVWVSETVDSKICSVFRGSIFESTAHEPIIILKLLYHWTCQTNIAVRKVQVCRNFFCSAV
jgi:hypothetical protein